jgi:anti-sigma factor ChrR (cupin superfamily)
MHILDEFLKMALEDEIRAAIAVGDLDRAETLTFAVEGLVVQAQQRRKAVLEALRRASLPQPELSATGG